MDRLAFGIAAFAAAIDVSESHVRREIKLGRIRPTLLGRRVMISRSEAERYLAQNSGLTS